MALSSGESELYALGALSAELIFAQAILKEFALSFLIHARADSSTARAVATKQGASRNETHTHEIPVYSRFGSSESDVGTKALGRERFYRMRSMLGMGTDLTETS